MLNVLFWNLHRNALEDLIETCVVENDIDVAIFSEFDGVDIDKIEEHLGKMYKHIFEIQNNKKVTLIAKNTLYVSICIRPLSAAIRAAFSGQTGPY